MVLKTKKFVFPYLLQTKEVLGVTKALLDGTLAFSSTVSLHSDPETDLTFEVATHPCRWLNVSIDFELSNHA